MEIMENGYSRDDSHPTAPFNDGGENSVLSSNFLLDTVGEIVLTQNSDGLSWQLVESLDDEKDESSCLGLRFVKRGTETKFSDVYAVEFLGWGLVHGPVFRARGCILGHSAQMYRFAVHAVQRSKTLPSLWNPSIYTFGHNNLEICKTWVNQISASLDMESNRPKNLLVFVHPRSGKGNGLGIWEALAPIFSRAKVKTKVIVTQRAGHARDVMTSITNRELSFYDGVVAVGGDGFFNEILNGLLLSRHKAPYPPDPGDSIHPVEKELNATIHNAAETILEPSDHNDHSPLLTGQDPEFSFPNKQFRIGIIPAGSTDAIAICTTGARDPLTSALQIVLGKRVNLDVAQIVRWKMTPASISEPCVRYAASFAGYGFYGDVITESEKYRWMGPKRYDYAGTKVFLQHRSYEAELNYLEVESEKENSSLEEESPDIATKAFHCLPTKSDRVSCRANCDVCNTKGVDALVGPSSPLPNSKDSRWLRSKGRFISVGAAVISCRNEKAPDGLVSDAHLSDGFMHLILIKDCPRPLYLWHLIQLTRRGGNPLDFEFVEHHKTPAFTFTSFGKEGVWNVDGELFLAHRLSAQVFRGLVSLFAGGPEA
ncbi:ceramide kinase isoform X1 [Olea europaea subsp. europaea]|uniref:Ceramide kinase isoform X1 n=1 Tax=Olea europaea subsp. europaea TaxID=158383 RepID=A0A8S0TKX1_OLEEU|nr:ceramide kinase isoform X1 [Olea europaea subsp. europaea]